MSGQFINVNLVEFENELYAERLRLQAQAAGLQSGDLAWSGDIPEMARRKVNYAWGDAISGISEHGRAKLAEAIRFRTSRSLGYEIGPEGMGLSFDDYLASDDYLSLIEAEHQELKILADAYRSSPKLPGHNPGERVTEAAVDTFQSELNRIFQAYLVGFHLHDNSRFVPIESHEMHNAVVAPALFLLHSEERFAGAEKAYQDALKELRNNEAGDAITDAGTALQEILGALGCKGNVLGDKLKAAKKMGLVRGSDGPLTDAIITWVAAQRNDGEVHTARHEYTPSDAWMVVHVVGALAIRLSESAAKGGE